MAAEQSVKAPRSFEELKSRAWPEDEPKDAFLEWLDEQRRLDREGDEGAA